MSVLGRMGAVIDADAENLSRIGDHGKELQALNIAVRLCTLGGAAQLIECIRRDDVLQRGIAAFEPFAQRDDATVRDNAEGWFSIGDIACELHLFLPFAGFAFIACFFAAFLAGCFETATGASGRVTIFPTPALVAQ